MPQFNVGDQVTIRTDSHYCGRSASFNPAHGVVGQVLNVDRLDDLPYTVEWPSGESNTYGEGDLEYVKEKPLPTRRVSFKTWMMKLEGKEIEEPKSVTFYSKPTEIYSMWENLLEHYSNTGRIDRDYLQTAFYWYSTDLPRDTWVRVHTGRILPPDEVYDRLDSWCEQENLPVPTERLGLSVEPVPAGNSGW